MESSYWQRIAKSGGNMKINPVVYIMFFTFSCSISFGMTYLNRLKIELQKQNLTSQMVRSEKKSGSDCLVVSQTRMSSCTESFVVCSATYPDDGEDGDEGHQDEDELAVHNVLEN